MLAFSRFGCLNAQATSAQIRATLSVDARAVMVGAARAGRLSARGFDRALRVARTCADLAGGEVVGEDDAREAVGHRSRLDQVWEVAA